MIDNFDEIDNNQLVKDAKQKLEKQKEEDLYAGFRDENDDSKETTDDKSYQDEDIQSLYATQQDELETINNEKLDEEYYQSQEEHPDIDAYEQLVCPGGPLKSQVDTWKRQFDKSNVHLVEIGRYLFVFRTLSRPEYKRLLTLDNLDALQREEVICHTTVLFPSDFSYKDIAELDAGIPSTLADLIMDKSGFTRDFTIEVL